MIGRVTYDKVTTELSPHTYPYANVDSYVITTQNRINADRVNFENRSVVDVVEELRHQYDKTVWIVGGSHVIQPLLEHDLIDEYQIAIIPVLLGEGIPLFRTFSRKINLSLVKHHVKNDMTYLTYARK